MVYGMGTEEKCSTIVKPELTVMLGRQASSCLDMLEEFYAEQGGKY